jgi:hypothetical protein
VLSGKVSNQHKEKHDIGFHKFISKVFFQQLILLIFTSAFLCLYLYYSWDKEIREKQKNFEATVNYNFSIYHQMIDMMQAKIQSKQHDTKSVLNTRKYNKFFSCGKIYAEIAGSYLVDAEKHL